MELITTVTTKGQVTIPSHIRQKMGIEPGDKAVFRTNPSHKKEVILTLIPTASTVAQLAGSLHKPGMKYIPIKEARRLAGIALAKKYGVNQKK